MLLEGKAVLQEVYQPMEAGSVLTSTQKLVKHNSTEATRDGGSRFGSFLPDPGSLTPAPSLPFPARKTPFVQLVSP